MREAAGPRGVASGVFADASGRMSVREHMIRTETHAWARK